MGRIDMENYRGEESEYSEEYLKAISHFNSAEFSLVKGAQEAYNRLEELAKKGKLKIKSNGGHAYFAIGKIYTREVKEKNKSKNVRYFISSVFRKIPPRKIDLEIHSENNIEKVLYDFENLTGIKIPNSIIIVNKPEKKINGEKKDIGGGKNE